MIFHENFLIFWLDTIEKQDIINLSGCCSKSNVSVDLSDSKVTSLWEEEEAAFRSFLLCVFHSVNR